MAAFGDGLLGGDSPEDSPEIDGVEDDFFAFAELRASGAIKLSDAGEEAQTAAAVDPAISFCRVLTPETWAQLKHKTDAAAFANTEVTKLVLDIRPEKERVLRGVKPGNELVDSSGFGPASAMFIPFFLQSEKFQWHFPFARCVFICVLCIFPFFTSSPQPEFPPCLRVSDLTSLRHPHQKRKHLMSKMAALNPYAHHTFNKKQYTEEERDFVLLTVTRFEDHGGVVCLELWPSDTLDADRVADVVETVKQFVSPELGEFCFHPMSPGQEKNCSRKVAAKGIRVITSGDLFGAVKYQPLTLGRAVGRIRFMTTKQLERTGSRALVIKVRFLKGVLFFLLFCFPARDICRWSLT
jgi:hypothetical protein